MTTDNDPRQYAIYPAFAVPMAQDFFPEPEALNRDLKALLLAREAEGARHANPAPSLTQQKDVFESDFELFSWKEDCIQRLKQFCWTSLWRTVQELNRYSPQDMQANFAHEHVRTKVGPDAANFADASLTLSLVAVETEQPAATDWLNLYFLSSGATIWFLESCRVSVSVACSFVGYTVKKDSLRYTDDLRNIVQRTNKVCHDNNRPSDPNRTDECREVARLALEHCRRYEYYNFFTIDLLWLSLYPLFG